MSNFKSLILMTAFSMIAACKTSESTNALQTANKVRSALLIIDVQNDFVAGGALAVPEGNDIVPIINKLSQSKKFDLVVATKDWHPKNHVSFASNQPGHKPGDIIDLNGFQQNLWPNHCVQGSKGAEFVPELELRHITSTVLKGTNPKVDSYSGFFDNNRLGQTNLDAILKKNQVTRVYVVGLAQDYCVKFTALDSKSLNYETYVITDATRAVNIHPKDGENALQELRSHDVQLISSEDLLR